MLTFSGANADPERQMGKDLAVRCRRSTLRNRVQPGVPSFGFISKGGSHNLPLPQRQNPAIAATTRSCSSARNSGNIGSASTSPAAVSLTGKSPAA